MIVAILCKLCPICLCAEWNSLIVFSIACCPAVGLLALGLQLCYNALYS